MLSASRFAPLLPPALWASRPGRRGRSRPFDFAAVEAQAQKLASEPYKDVPPIGGDMKKLSYDKYRALRTKPETALWRDSGLFRVEFFPAGFIYDTPVNLGIVDDGNVTPVTIGSRPVRLQRHRPQGAAQGPRARRLQDHLIRSTGRTTSTRSWPSWARAISARSAASQVYGARRAAWRSTPPTAGPRNSPPSAAFWLVKPAPEPRELDGLGPARLAGGGRRLRLHHPARRHARWSSRMATLFLRHDVSLLAIAPLTCMFFAGKSGAAARRLPAGSPRFRRTVTSPRDKASGSGGRWPIRRRSPSPRFSDNNPRGFGLMQRERPSRIIRTPTHPSSVGPACGSSRSATGATARCAWSRFPTDAETNDNIVGLLGAALATQAGRAARLSATACPRWPTMRRSPRRGASWRRASPRSCPNKRQAAPLRRRIRRRRSRPAARGTTGRRGRCSVERQALRKHVEACPAERSWRLFIDFEPDGKKPVDMRAFLTLARRADRNLIRRVPGP